MRESYDLEQKATEIASMCQVLRNTLNRMIFTENKLRSFRDYQQLQVARIAKLGIVKYPKISSLKQSKNIPFKTKKQPDVQLDRKPFVSTSNKQYIQRKPDLVQQPKNKQNFDNLRDSKLSKHDDLLRDIIELIKHDDSNYLEKDQLMSKMGDREILKYTENEETDNLGINTVKLEESYESQTGTNEDSSEQQIKEQTQNDKPKLLEKTPQSNQIHIDSNNLIQLSPNGYSPERKYPSLGLKFVPFSQEFKSQMQTSDFQYGMNIDKRILGKELNSMSKGINMNSNGISSSSSSSMVEHNYSSQNNCSNFHKRKEGDFYQSPLNEKIEHNFLKLYNNPHRVLRGECKCCDCNHALVPQPFSPVIPLDRFNQPPLKIPFSNFYVQNKKQSFQQSSPQQNQPIQINKMSQIDQEIEQEGKSQQISIKIKNVEPKIKAPSPCPKKSSQAILLPTPPQPSQLLNQNIHRTQQIPGSIHIKDKKFPSVIFIEGNKKFQCQICKKTFDSKQKLGGHKARSHPDAPCQRTEREKKRKRNKSLEEADVMTNQEKNEKLLKPINENHPDNQVLQEKFNPQVTQETENNLKNSSEKQQTVLNDEENNKNNRNQFCNIDSIILNSQSEKIKESLNLPQLLKKAIQKIKHQMNQNKSD